MRNIAEASSSPPIISSTIGLNPGCGTTAAACSDGTEVSSGSTGTWVSMGCGISSRAETVIFGLGISEVKAGGTGLSAGSSSGG